MYYEVPIQELLREAGLQVRNSPSLYQSSDLRRGYEYVIADPQFSQFRKPAARPPEDTQKFIVQMYEFYTGKKLI